MYLRGSMMGGLEGKISGLHVEGVDAAEPRPRDLPILDINGLFFSCRCRGAGGRVVGFLRRFCLLVMRLRHICLVFFLFCRSCNGNHCGGGGL